MSSVELLLFYENDCDDYDLVVSLLLAVVLL